MCAPPPLPSLYLGINIVAPAPLSPYYTIETSALAHCATLSWSGGAHEETASAGNEANYKRNSIAFPLCQLMRQQKSQFVTQLYLHLYLTKLIATIYFKFPSIYCGLLLLMNTYRLAIFRQKG